MRARSAGGPAGHTGPPRRQAAHYPPPGEGETSSDDDVDAISPEALELLRSSEKTSDRAKATDTIGGYRRRMLELHKFCVKVFHEKREMFDVRPIPNNVSKQMAPLMRVW